MLLLITTLAYVGIPFFIGLFYHFCNIFIFCDFIRVCFIWCFQCFGEVVLPIII